MNFDNGTAYTESDADDEYDDGIADSSPVADSDAHYDSELPSSNEHTPTTYGHRSSADRLPETIISEWTADECADFISTIGLDQYSDIFIDNDIVGEALIALLHDDLKSMGIGSVGHRLTILKSVYDVKKAQDVPVESDHYIPLSAEAEAQSATATLQDIKHLVEQLRLRDERMSLVEQDLRRLNDDFRRLREDMLPALRLAKDAQQPLPINPNNGNNQVYTFEASTLSPPVPTPVTTTTPNLRRFNSVNNKKIQLGPAPKNNSPTHLQISHAIPEQVLDPSPAAERAAQQNALLSATMQNGSGQSTSPIFPSPNMPSPTSPPSYGTNLPPRTYRSQPDGSGAPPSSTRSTFPDSDRSARGGPPGRNPTPAPDTPSSSNASVEIFKSFRVSMEDPCYKVLPAALRKYQINAPWDQYALYIVYGDQERCLGLDEKPLILFKQLDREGKKPMFMLRKTNNAQVDLTSDMPPGSAGLTSARGATTPYDPPGGII